MIPIRIITLRTATTPSSQSPKDRPSGMSTGARTFGPSRKPSNVRRAFGLILVVAVRRQLTTIPSAAQESIYILDWWLSPEIYLRRPPSKNEEYRLDHMLKAAAERGVKVHIIVYKEVEAALTRKYLSSCLGLLALTFPSQLARK